jgi:ribosome-associated protein
MDGRQRGSGDGVPASEEAVALAVLAAAAAEDRSATDAAVLEVADVLVIADLFLVVSVSNERQLGAVASAIEEALHAEGRRPLRREGVPSSGWVLIDFGDLVCHVLHVEQRDFYALERLWADVPHRDPRTGAVLERA